MKKILFLSLVFLSLPSCQKDRGAAVPSPEEAELGAQVGDLESQLLELEEQLSEEQNLRIQESSEHASLLAEMKAMLKEVADSRKEESVELVSISESQPVEVSESVDEDQEARRIARLKAQGETYDFLETISGEKFHELVINRITDIGVVFRHRGGVSRVPFTDLTAAWQERFYYDEKLATLAQEKERLAQVRIERAEQVRLAKLQQEQTAANTMSLERLAQAVEGLAQGGTGSETVVREQIFVDPPIIVGNHRGRINNTYCPPVINSHVIRPSSNIVPTTRPQVLQVGRPLSSSALCPTPARPTVQPSRPSTPVRPSVQRPSSRPTPVRPSVQRPRPTPVRPSTSRLR